eukprot:CAMPEP_0194341790 /NCGR_PEP_ID=MMETSP0171-20130528/90768_1 /TAXON_ID=218684 /ORGANISM="Corethron pennatum, Strain L29A3" /LENGTH=103 /DNA_ID=CAMNT_0039107253 /DNA_START=395 /DNA_END=706 /DNA_ORIENTATION=+
MSLHALDREVTPEIPGVHPGEGQAESPAWSPHRRNSVEVAAAAQGGHPYLRGWHGGVRRRQVGGAVGEGEKVVQAGSGDAPAVIGNLDSDVLGTLDNHDGNWG